MTNAQRRFLVVALSISAVVLTAVTTELTSHGSSFGRLILVELPWGPGCHPSTPDTMTFEGANSGEVEVCGWYLKHRQPYGLIVGVILPMVLLGAAGYLHFGASR